MHHSLKPVVLGKAIGETHAYLRPHQAELYTGYEKIIGLTKDREANIREIEGLLSTTPLALRALQKKMNSKLPQPQSLLSIFSSDSHDAIQAPKSRRALLQKVQRRRNKHEQTLLKIRNSQEQGPSTENLLIRQRKRTQELLDSLPLNSEFWANIRANLKDVNLKFERIELHYKRQIEQLVDLPIALEDLLCAPVMLPLPFSRYSVKKQEEIQSLAYSLRTELHIIEGKWGVSWRHARYLENRIIKHELKIADIRDRIVEAHLPLVIKVAKSYTFRGLDLKDLVQEGLMGITRAIQSFDYRKGFRFSTYAYWWVKQAVGRAVMDQGKTIRIPINQMTNLSKVRKAEAYLQGHSTQEVTAKQIADELDRPEKFVAETLSIVRQPISLDLPLKSEGDSTLVDIIPSTKEETVEAKIDNQFMKKQLDSLLDLLNPRQEEVIRMRYGIGRPSAVSLEEIGEKLGVSRERARQIEVRALEILREFCTTELELLLRPNELPI